MNRGTAARWAAAIGAAGLVAVVPAAIAKLPSGLEGKIELAIAAEKRALKTFDVDKSATRHQLEGSLSDLNSAISDLPEASGSVFSDLKQAAIGDEIALRFLDSPANQGFARGKLNIAILRKESALGIEKSEPQTTPPPTAYPKPDAPPLPPPPKPAPRAQPGSPNDVLRVLELMDKRFKSTIKNLESSSLNVDETKAAIDGIAALKMKTIGLLPSECGLSPLEVYPVIEAAEKDVLDATNATDHASSVASVAAAVQAIQGLNTAISQLGQCPQLNTALTQLIGMLSAVQTSAQPQTSYASALATILNVTMLQTWAMFPGPFGLSFAFVARTLNLIDLRLDQANALAGWSFEVAIRLARAERLKVALENSLRGVLTINTTVGPPTITTGG